MTGDFSRWHYGRRDNFNGVLAQQGRVLLDADGTAQTRIVTDWQDVAAEDIIGGGVAAVPASTPGAFFVNRARVQAGQVIVTIEPGRVWADGLLVHLEEETPVDRVAPYFGPPIQSPQASVGTIAAGVRDAVVLEVFREAINGFQIPDLLIEPALGGPDTAERVYTSAALRLYRMGPDDTCTSIPLADDFSKKGRLKATLQPTTAGSGDCPVVEGGGYTGFEHHLYRVEIAHTNAGGPRFKWSRFNGGLVGRGLFDAAALRVNITANLSAINTCGLSTFYLEAVEFDSQQGRWMVTYGAPVTLNSSNQLVLPPAAGFGAIPPSTTPVFFRLWDGIRDISAFPPGPNPVELEDGIRLEFEALAPGSYTPQDYWTFQVRAGGLGNPPILIDTKPPHGIHYHRVPLGVITWNAALDVTAAAGGISDCRHPFPPLTGLSGCCTYTVGDGVASHGDFTSVQAAIDKLPASGGEICIMPGIYRESVQIRNRINIRIHGCGPRSRIVGAGSIRRAATPAVIHVIDSSGIKIDSLAVEAEERGIGILLDGTGFGPAPQAAAARIPMLRDIELMQLRITALARSAIEARHGQSIEIRRCDIRMLDGPTAWPGIFFLGDDGLIEENQVRVHPRPQLDAGITLAVPAAVAALGGIQIGGTSERVRIIGNLIQGGIGNGITLGSVIVLDPAGKDTGILIGWVVNPNDPCNPCKPGTVVFPPGGGGDDPGTRTVSAGPLTEIRIERNRIFDMGLNGISVAAFFDLKQNPETISVQGLDVVGNHIRGCLRREIEAIPDAMLERVGYGGIALADVDALVVWENIIEKNGPRRTDPVCGIFVLSGEGVDISRNYIVDNGARTAEPITSAKNGQRGGIVIRHAISPPVPIPGPVITAAPFVTVQSGRPAVRVHDNVVVAPMGRAVSITALGAVSVVGNQLVTQAVAPRQTGSNEGVIAAAVYINDLGRNFELEQWRAGYQTIAHGNLQPDNSYSFSNGSFTLAGRGNVAAAERLFFGGPVLFAANQVTLDLVEPGLTLGLASIAIASLDDIGFTANQCLAQLADDYLYFHTALYGTSLRATDNRWEEPIGNVLYSAVTIGAMNATVNNIATHCIVAQAPPKLLIGGPNIVRLSAFNENPCADAAKVLGSFGGARG